MAEIKYIQCQKEDFLTLLKGNPFFNSCMSEFFEVR
jgi:hypothetical protein